MDPTGCRRGSRLLLVVVAVLPAPLVAARASGVSVRQSAVPSVGVLPSVDVRAFLGQGRLAFVSAERLWLLDGVTGKLIELPSVSDLAPEGPMFSSDGRWLTYMEVDPEQAEPSQVWIARSDGTDAHPLRRLVDPVSVIGWSPTSDVIAVIGGPERHRQPCPCNSPTTLTLVTPMGATRLLASSPDIYHAAWGPKGRSIALASITLRVSQLVTYSAAGGQRTVWLSLGHHRRLDGMNDILIDTAGWWPGLGIGFWVFGDGSVRNPDETPLDLVPAPGRTPRLLGQTLSDPDTTDIASASSDGQLAIVNDLGLGRVEWAGKQVKLCSATATVCRAIVSTPGKVTVDPVWSPDGQTLLFAQAPSVQTGPWSQARVAAWYAARRLELYTPATHSLEPLPAADGAAAPVWSADGTGLVYVREDALWLLPTLGDRPVRIAGPLFPPDDWPQYYAQINWSAQFAWSSRPPGS